MDLDSDMYVQPKAGRFLSFTSSVENIHRVTPVTSGNRLLLSCGTNILIMGDQRIVLFLSFFFSGALDLARKGERGKGKGKGREGEGKGKGFFLYFMLGWYLLADPSICNFLVNTQPTVLLLITSVVCG
jgi:hypothetical protein